MVFVSLANLNITSSLVKPTLALQFHHKWLTVLTIRDLLPVHRVYQDIILKELHARAQPH